ncbi:MAG: hypothetical protein K0S34_70 [Bacillales bacterium]|jgi:hypothetical protein|nr:hypothetical protein [Bacillales bacterium]
MLLRVKYAEFPMLNGRIIPKCTNYTTVVNVDYNEDQLELSKDIKSLIASETKVSQECIKIMSWSEV